MYTLENQMYVDVVHLLEYQCSTFILLLWAAVNVSLDDSIQSICHYC